MGWMRTILLGDIGNRLDIEDTERDIARLRRKQSRDAKALVTKRREIDALKDEVGQLKLATHALTRFLIEKGQIDLNELEDFIREVDLEDGKIDGKIAVDPSTRRLRFAEKPDIPEGAFRKMDDPGTS
jgi:hypothetical protein